MGVQSRPIRLPIHAKGQSVLKGQAFSTDRREGRGIKQIAACSPGAGPCQVHRAFFFRWRAGLPDLPTDGRAGRQPPTACPSSSTLPQWRRRKRLIVRELTQVFFHGWPTPRGFSADLPIGPPATKPRRVEVAGQFEGVSSRGTQVVEKSERPPLAFPRKLRWRNNITGIDAADFFVNQGRPVKQAFPLQSFIAPEKIVHFEQGRQARKRKSQELTWTEDLAAAPCPKGQVTFHLKAQPCPHPEIKTKDPNPGHGPGPDRQGWSISWQR